MPSPAATPPARAKWRLAVGATLGILSGAVALAIAHLVAGVLDGASSPVLAVGGVVVDVTPEWLKSFAIRTFGTADKLVLLGGIGVVLALTAVLLGIASVRRPILAISGLLSLAFIGAVAAVTRPSNGPMAAVPSLAGGMAGIGAYILLRRAAGLPPVGSREVSELEKPLPARAATTDAGSSGQRSQPLGSRSRQIGSGSGSCAALTRATRAPPSVSPMRSSRRRPCPRVRT
jgi:hypothetical protein